MMGLTKKSYTADEIPFAKDCMWIHPNVPKDQENQLCSRLTLQQNSTLLLIYFWAL